MINDPTITRLVSGLRVGDVIVKDVDFDGVRVYIESVIVEVLDTAYVHPHVEDVTWSIFKVNNRGNITLPTQGATHMFLNGSTVQTLRTTTSA